MDNENPEKAPETIGNVDQTLVRAVDLANLLDVSEARMVNLARERKFAKDEKGFYKLGPCIREFIRHLKAKGGGKKRGGSLNDAQTENIQLKNDLLEIQLDEKNGELLPVQDVAKEWERMIIGARQRFLSVPTKAAPILAHVTEPMEIQAILEKFIREALSELAINADPQKEKNNKPKKDSAKSQEPSPSNPPAVPAPAAP